MTPEQLRELAQKLRAANPRTVIAHADAAADELDAHAAMMEEVDLLVARVRELEAKVRLLNIFRGCAMDAIEAHEITNQGDSDVIGVLIDIAARSKP